jgi:hypothetical protein
MKRREFITLLGGVAAWPLAVRAQQAERMRRIGVLLPAVADDPEWQARVGAFLQALALLGWTIGRNVRIDIRWATTNAGEIRRHAAELAALRLLQHNLPVADTLRPCAQWVVSGPLVIRHTDKAARSLCPTSLAAQAILKNLRWRFCSMAKLVFGLNQSLDGYVDYLEFAPGPSLFRHFYEQVRDLTGSVYGRRMYEVMRIWDEDRPEWCHRSDRKADQDAASLERGEPAG